MQSASNTTGVKALHAFSPEFARALPGPAWLRARREVAAAQLSSMEVPTAELEDWRYSPIGDLDLTAYQPLHPSGEAPAGLPAGARAALEPFVGPAGVLVLCNGRVVHATLADDVAAQGVIFGPLADAPGAEDLLGAVSGAPADLFAALNLAFGLEPSVLHVPRGVAVDRPFVLVSWVKAAGVATFPRLVVRLEEAAAAQVVEIQGGDDVEALCVPVTELDLQRASRLDMVTLQERSTATWQLATVAARVGQEASARVAHAALGGRYARSRVTCRLEGRGASGDLYAAYFGQGDQTMDFRTFQQHAAPDTTSNLLFKGALDDRSRSVYTGLIRVEKDARGTNAFQTNRNIKLSEDAWAESVPNLEIENNDVRCSHASTVGPIDADQRFYLESRGVPPTVAERLVVAGFFDEVLDAMAVPEIRDHVRGAIVARLAAREQ